MQLTSTIAAAIAVALAILALVTLRHQQPPASGDTEPAEAATAGRGGGPERADG